MSDRHLRDRGAGHGFMAEELRAYFQEHGECANYSGAWYRALVSVGYLTFADVVEVTGLPVSDVVDMLEN